MWPGTASSIKMNDLRHDTFDSYYRSPSGAVEAGMSVTLRLRTAVGNASTVTLRVYLYDAATDSTTPVDYPMSFFEHRVENGKTYDIWSITIARLRRRRSSTTSSR
jgi:hypothetical protein